MKIKSIDINNGLQHKKLHADFTDFNVIIGPNGCGKSSVIELIGFGLTNKFTWPGTLDTMIRQGEDKGNVKLVIEDEGEEITLKTALGKTSRSLVRGDTKLNKSSEVIEYVQEVLLRTPFELVNEASIVRQGQLDAGLFTTQAKRQQIFQRLAGLNNVETKRKQLADAKALCTPFMLSFDLDEKKRQVEELTKRTVELEAEHKALTDVQTSQEQYDQCKVLLANLDNMAKYSAEQVKLTAEQKEMDALHSDAETELANAKVMLESLTASLEEKQAGYDKALVTVATAEAAAKQLAEKQRLTAKLMQANTAIESMVPVAPTFNDDVAIQEFEKIQAEAQNELKQAVRVRDNLSASDKRCPTCHTVLEDPASIIAESIDTIEEMDGIAAAAATQLTTLKAARRTWEHQLESYRNTLSSFTSTIENTKASLNAMGDVAPAEGDGSAQQVIDEYTVVSSSARDIRAKHTEVQAVYTEVDTALKVCTTKLNAVNQNLAGLSTDDTKTVSVIEAREYTKAFDEHKTALDSITGQLTEVARQHKEAVQGLAATEEKAEDARKYKEFSDHIEFARSALHRDNFPSGKIKAFIDRVLINSESYLEEMQAGFTVSYEHENGFIAHFPQDGRIIRADRLSGGEKVTFALAFRFAVNEVKSETGFLMLDEPTAHLDDAHVDNVVRVLELVKRKLAGHVQLFIVTHDERMTAVADTVLEVNRASA